MNINLENIDLNNNVLDKFIMKMSDEDLKNEIKILMNLDYNKFNSYTHKCYQRLLKQLNNEQLYRLNKLHSKLERTY